MESLRVRGLFEQYETLAEFRIKFARQLAQKMISHFPTIVESAAAKGSAVDSPRAIPSRVPSLGDSARELLAEAVKDGQGVIMSLQTLQGSHVQTNGRDFVEGGPRSEAQWRGAVAELHRLGLVEDRAGTGEVFFVTDAGYRTAEVLNE
jgi:hypothetical protein